MKRETDCILPIVFRTKEWWQKVFAVFLLLKIGDFLMDELIVKNLQTPWWKCFREECILLLKRKGWRSCRGKHAEELKSWNRKWYIERIGCDRWSLGKRGRTAREGKRETKKKEEKKKEWQKRGRKKRRKGRLSKKKIYIIEERE